MKQCESDVHIIGDGVVVIFECANVGKIPRVTLMHPDRFDTSDKLIEKAASYQLYNEEVRQLYRTLKQYFEE
ncbi:MAG: hypothetical protein WC554_04310 [Clostridia bacterium]